MKIHYWGTAAAEGIPAIFCDCEVCRDARLKKGHAVRTRSQIMLDDTLLIDFGADTYAHSIMYDYDMSKLRDVLITHVHEDHFYPMELLNCGKDGVHYKEHKPLIFHGSEDMKKEFIYVVKGKDDLIREGRLIFDERKAFETFQIGDFKVTALPARHGTEHPYVYTISKGGKNVLLLNDTGLLQKETYAWLKASNMKFDLISYECTAGYFSARAAWGDDAELYCHMGLWDDVEVRSKLMENGNCTTHTRHIITHFSHNGKDAEYDKMKLHAMENGFELAFDGMVVTI